MVREALSDEILPAMEHDGLERGGHGRRTDTGTDHHRNTVLGHVLRRSTESAKSKEKEARNGISEREGHKNTSHLSGRLHSLKSDL